MSFRNASRRSFLKGALAGAGAGVAALGLEGCARPQRQEPGVVTLDFFNYATLEFLDLYTRRLIPQFEREHPGIRIRHHSSMGDAGYDAKLLTLIAGKLTPDLIHVTQNNFPFWAANDVLLPLDELIGQDESFVRAEFFERVIDGMCFGGKQLGLPSDFSTIIMFYNQTHFDACRVEYPRAGWTWEDYLQIARRLTRDTDGDGRVDIYGTGNPNSYNRWPAWVWGNGGEVLSADLKKCLMDTSESIGGLQFYIDLALVHKVAPTPAQSMGQDLDDLFGKQICAMMANSRYPYKKYIVKTPLRFKWDVCEMPQGPAKHATTFIWGGNCIMRATKHPAEAWTFLKFLSGEAGAAMTLAGGNALPAYRRSAEEAVLKNPDPRWPKHDVLFLEAVEHAQSPPAPSAYAEYTQAMGVLHDAYLGLRSVEDACGEFTRQANEILTSEVF